MEIVHGIVYYLLMFCNWIENNVQTLSINNWRASLVPAAAVIPAPIAYINVVAVKKLVVEMKGSCVMNTFVYFVIQVSSF